MSTSGKYLYTTVGAVAFVPTLTEWEARETGEALDATSGYTAGYEDTDDGVHGVEITIRFLHDPARGAFPPVTKGTILTNFRAFSNSSNATPDYWLPVGIVVDPGRTTRVRGQIEGTYKVRNKGIFYRDGIAG